MITGLVRLVVGTVTMLLWSVIGLVFWIPLLARSVAVFSSLVLYSALTNQSTKAAGQWMNTAIAFYATGFKRIWEALSSDTVDAPSPPLKFQLGRFLGEIIWCGLFWIITLYASGNIGRLILYNILYNIFYLIGSKLP